MRIIAACPNCGAERLTTKARALRWCKPCSNRRTAERQKVPVKMWIVSCPDCKGDVSFKGTRPEIRVCLHCRTRRGALALASIKNARPRPLCSSGGCPRIVRGRKTLCVNHLEETRRKANLDHHRQLRRANYIRSKDKIQARQAARSLAKRKSPMQERKAIAAFYLSLKIEPTLACYWCSKVTAPKDRHGDHIIPLSRGGSHTLSNLCCACVRCNTSKQNKLPEEFRAYAVAA